MGSDSATIARFTIMRNPFASARAQFLGVYRSRFEPVLDEEFPVHPSVPGDSPVYAHPSGLWKQQRGAAERLAVGARRRPRLPLARSLAAGSSRTFDEMRATDPGDGGVSLPDLAFRFGRGVAVRWRALV